MTLFMRHAALYLLLLFQTNAFRSSSHPHRPPFQFIRGQEKSETKPSSDEETYIQKLFSEKRRKNISIMRNISTHKLDTLQHRRDYAGWVETKKHLKKLQANDVMFEMNKNIKDAIWLDDQVKVTQPKQSLEMVGAPPSGTRHAQEHAAVTENYDTSIGLHKTENITKTKQIELASSRYLSEGINNTYTSWALEHESNYDGSAFLGGKDNGIPFSANGPLVAIHWTIDTISSLLHLAVAVKATGWVGLGFAEMGGMPGSDMFIFQASEPDTILDAYATAYEKPKPDKQQDWTLVSSTVDDGFIIIESNRKLDTGDAMDWLLKDDSNLAMPGTRVIAAWGDDVNMHYHGPDQRVQGSVRFFHKDKSNEKSLFQELMDNEAEGSVFLGINNFQIPKRQVTYEHRCFKVSDLVKQQKLPTTGLLHVIGLEWKIDMDNIHHIGLYFSTSEKILKCDETGPISFLAIFNKGQEKVTIFPKDIGLLLADESSGSNKFFESVPKSFRLEIHYENPKKKKGIFDSSGVKIYYTSKLRKHTGALLELGDPTVKLWGKPIGKGIRQHSFHCPDTCFSQHVHNEQGITVLYEMFHMHSHGLTMKNIHMRKGKEIRRSAIEFFDFAQGSGFVKQKSFKVLPGDSFETQCIYEGNDKLTFGPEAKTEMCLIWILYYPAASKHLSCSIESITGEECAASHSSVELVDKSAMGRTFGVEKEIEAKTQVSKHLANGNNDMVIEAKSNEKVEENNYWKVVLDAKVVLGIFIIVTLGGLGLIWKQINRHHRRCCYSASGFLPLVKKNAKVCVE